jgi:hypothetical protein
MNTRTTLTNTALSTPLFARASSLACAFVFTFAMLAGVDGLATHDVNPNSLLAAAAASQPTHG